MLPTPKSYAIRPVTVPADQVTHMTILPTERSFLLFDGEEYTVKIMDVNDDTLSYENPPSLQTLTLTAKNGVLQFDYCFAEEQEHTIHLIYQDKLLQVLSVYSLKEDLYALRPLRGDLHAHSYRSDGKRDPAALAGHFREQGYDFFALTDHNRYYPGGEIDEVYKDVKTGFCHVQGEEVHTPPSKVHIVHVGGNQSVAEQYLHDRANYEQARVDYLSRVPESVPQKYAERYAMAMWATDRIHEAGGVAIFAHPYWRPKDLIYNVNDEFTKILLRSGMFDAYELVGGMGQDGVNRSVALWNDLRAEGLSLAVVGSSDVHGLAKSVDFPDHFTVLFATENTNDAVIEAIKAQMSVAVEACGTEYDRQYRCYGNLRLVSYALFLLKHYFPIRERLCQGEGVAMRAYAMGETAAKTVELYAKLCEDFADIFFGKSAPNLPSAKIRKFENKWRKTHLERGPITKGSGIDSDTVSRQI